MLVASFSDHQIYNKSSIDAVFGATVQNGWSSRFGNAPTNALRVHAGASANSGGSGSTFDFYYKQTTAVAYKRWFSGNSGVNQGYVYGADVHYAMLQTNGAYNLKYRVDYPNHQFNNFSDPSGTWPDWWGGLTTGGVSLNFNGAQDGSFGVSNGPGRTGQDMSGNNAIVGMDDGLTMFVACSSGTDFCFGNPTANNTSASTNVWIWIK
jgi:hypothetical protein